MTKRVAFAVYVELDLMPGVFHTEESARDTVLVILNASLKKYNVTVAYGSDSMQPEKVGLRRPLVLTVYLNLDPNPGSMNTVDWAYDVVRSVLHDAIPHYNPIVSDVRNQFWANNNLEGAVHA